jgi:hypothetical protein
MTIHTTIKSYVNKDIIGDFSHQLSKKGINPNVEIDNGEWSNFTGDEIADIIIFIKQHRDELIVGLVGSAVFEILKFSIAKMWKGLKKAVFTEKDKDDPEQKHISVRIEDTDGRLVEIEFKGNIPVENIEQTIDKAFQYLDKNKKNEIFSDRNYVNEYMGQESVQLHYNAQTDTWDPYNFAELKKQWDDLKNVDFES